MAAQRDSQHDRQPRYTLPLAQGYAQDASERLPFAPAHFALTEAMRFPVWYPCQRCNGTGRQDGERIVCRVCSAAWWRQDVEQRGHRGMRSTMLPCAHALPNHDLVYAPPLCPTCGGEGGFIVLVTLAAALDWLETIYAAISEQTTARHIAR